MKNHTINPETLRKRNSKQKETPKERAARLKRERERKRQKRAEETDEARDARLTKAREQKNRKRAAEFIDEREKRLARERVYKRTTRNSRQTQPRQGAPEQNQINTDTHVRSSATNISEDGRRVLQKFRSKMDSIEYKLCPVCNERIPSMVLVNKMCRR